MQNVDAQRLLSCQQVQALVGISRSSLYALVARGQFPRQVQITARRVGWMYSSVHAWIEARPEVRKRVM